LERNPTPNVATLLERRLQTVGDVKNSVVCGRGGKMCCCLEGVIHVSAAA
jgi:hypothetical protein